MTRVLGRSLRLTRKEFKRESNPRCRTTRAGLHVLASRPCYLNWRASCLRTRHYFFARVSHLLIVLRRLLDFESVIPDSGGKKGKKKTERSSCKFITNELCTTSRLSRTFLKRWKKCLIRDVREN